VTRGENWLRESEHLHLYGRRQYFFDAQGRLSSVATVDGPDSPVTRYSHNQLGQRVFKTVPQYSDEEPVAGQEQSFWDAMVAFFSQLWSPQTQSNEQAGWAYAYDENGTLLAEEGMGGTTAGESAMYIWLPTANGPMPIAAMVNGEKFAIHAHHLNTPRRLTNALGQAAWQWKFSAFRDEVPTTAANRFVDPQATPGLGSAAVAHVSFNLRYPGQYADSESGLHYNYFRSYDGSMGRYTQADPIGLDGGWNRFSYVSNSPLESADPTGLAAAGAMVGGQVGAALGGRLGPLGSRAGRAVGAAIGSAIEDICIPESPCEKKRQEIEEWVVAMEKKYLEMQLDRNGLFDKASTGTWEGHVSRYNGMKRRLRNLVDEAVAMGCVVPPKAYELLARPVPQQPTP
jgi:RHS repeat-associated protein